MSATAFQPGDRVTIRQNDAKVAAGSLGIVIGHSSETGHPLVDVEGRGRVSFTPDSLELTKVHDAVRTTDEERLVSDEMAPRKKRTMSPEARARIAEAQRARHRLLREANECPKAVSPGAIASSNDDDAAAIRCALSVAARHGLGASTLIELAQLLAAIESTA